MTATLTRRAALAALALPAWPLCAQTAGYPQHPITLTVTLTVPYKATPALLGALRDGEIDFAFEVLGPCLTQISGGTLQALAVSGAQRPLDLAEVPTVAEAGRPALARYEVSSWNGLAAPALTPPRLPRHLPAQPPLERP